MGQSRPTAAPAAGDVSRQGFFSLIGQLFGYMPIHLEGDAPRHSTAVCCSAHGFCSCIEDDETPENAVEAAQRP